MIMNLGSAHVRPCTGYIHVHAEKRSKPWLINIYTLGLTMFIPWILKPLNVFSGNKGFEFSMMLANIGQN